MGTVMNEGRRQILLDTPHTETATGAVATFETDMVGRAKEVKVEIEAVQDLNGYDSPWPAGGGKNKLASNATKDVKITGAQTIVVSLTKNVAEITIDRDMTASIGYRFNDGSIETVLPAGEYFFSTNITNQQAGSGLFIFDATTATILGRARAEGGARISLSAETTVRLGLSLSAGTKAGTYWFQLESGSTATSFAPYSNICPISGWTGANVQRTGKNLCGGTFVNMAIATFTGGVMVVANPSYRGFYVRAVGGNSYTISRTIIETNRFRIGATVEEPAPVLPAIWLAQLPSQDSAYSVTVTLPEGYNYIFVYLSNQADTCTANNYQVEHGSTATAYEPYSGSTTPISWADEAGTVYGGYLTWLWDGSVKLVVDRAEVDLGTLNYSLYNPTVTNIPVFYCTVNGIKPSSGGLCKSSVYKCMYWSSLQARIDHTIEVHPTLQYIYIADSRYETTASFKTAMSGVQLAYELAAPQTYTLTPQEALVFLRGTNNVWNDINDTTVTYWTHKTGDSV